jgi:SpoVK/Ycf46/Vps4 family AAA+-type ATPase
MPRYFYECSVCNSQFKVVHGMTEQQSHCELCFADNKNLRRIPQITTTQKSPSEEGKRIKQAIEDNKEIFKEMDREARSTTYDD